MTSLVNENFYLDYSYSYNWLYRHLQCYVFELYWDFWSGLTILPKILEKENFGFYLTNPINKIWLCWLNFLCQDLNIVINCKIFAKLKLITHPYKVNGKPTEVVSKPHGNSYFMINMCYYRDRLTVQWKPQQCVYSK